MLILQGYCISSEEFPDSKYFAGANYFTGNVWSQEECNSAYTCYSVEGGGPTEYDCSAGSYVIGNARPIS